MSLVTNRLTPVSVGFLFLVLANLGMGLAVWYGLSNDITVLSYSGGAFGTFANMVPFGIGVHRSLNTEGFGLSLFTLGALGMLIGAGICLTVGPP